MKSRTTIQMYIKGSYNSWSEARGSGAVYEQELGETNASHGDILNIIDHTIDIVCDCLGCDSLKVRIKTETIEDLM